jgi:hypothetical protein
VPFYHTGVEWSELLQGIFVAGPTGLALVPLLTSEFGLGFEEAVACICIHTVLIASAPIVFGEPMAPGWLTPALPLVLLQVLAVDSSGSAAFPTPAERFQFMTAVTLVFALIVFLMGFTGLGRRIFGWLPPALKGGIIMGAAIAAFKRVVMDDAEAYLYNQPVSMTLAIAICLFLTFSAPVQRWKRKSKALAIIAGLGLLPGFMAAAAAGPIFNEIEYEIEWGFLVPPFVDFFDKVSPFAIGWPGWSIFLAALPLAVIGYVLLFGDIITGTEILRDNQPCRPDENIDLDINRTHHSVGVRNLLMALLAPFFPTQGCLWTGVHVIVVQRWKEGKEFMGSLFGGLSSYYVYALGIPVLYCIKPLTSAVRPLLGIALSLTFILTGFACAHIAMAGAKTPAERGVVLLTGISLAFFHPWVGFSVGIISTSLLVGTGSARQT